MNLILWYNYFMLIDTHCHLHDQEWFTPEQQADFLRQAHDNGVEKIICIGTDPTDSQHARDFATQHKNVYWTYGIHPEFADDYTETEGNFAPGSKLFATDEDRAKRGVPVTTGEGGALSAFEIMELDSWGGRGPESLDEGSVPLISKADKAQPRPVAIGEIGLDYHYPGYSRTAQIHLFEQMLQLALDHDLPVSLHIREAFADAWPVIDNFPQLTGVLHSFTGSKRELGRALDRGFLIGVNGLVTYTTIPLPPLENMVLETDAPFLTPNPFRGTINSPAYVKTIATYLAAELGVAESKIMEQTTKNARKIFQI